MLEKCPYIRAATPEPMRNKEIVTKPVFLLLASVLEYELDT